MQKYSILLLSPLLIMSENVIGMQIFKKLYSNPTISTVRNFNNNLIHKHNREFNSQTISRIYDLLIEINESNAQISKLGCFVLYDLSDEALVKKAIARDDEVAMHKELIAKNKNFLSYYVQEYLETQNNIKEAK